MFGGGDEKSGMETHFNFASVQPPLLLGCVLVSTRVVANTRPVPRRLKRFLAEVEGFFVAGLADWRVAVGHVQVVAFPLCIEPNVKPLPRKTNHPPLIPFSPLSFSLSPPLVSSALCCTAAMHGSLHILARVQCQALDCRNQLNSQNKSVHIYIHVLKISYIIDSMRKLPRNKSKTHTHQTRTRPSAAAAVSTMAAQMFCFLHTQKKHFP